MSSCRRIAALAGLVGVLGGATWIVAGAGGGEPRADRPDAFVGETARVERRTLVERESVDGKLGYGGSRAVIYRAAGRQGDGGTLTEIAREGSTVRRGGVLYRVDGRPVVLFYGRLPSYRRLAPGVSDGADVRELEENLVALGYGSGVTVDEAFTDATAAAVKRWQGALGARRTGAVELGSVSVQPGPRRIGAHKLTAGAPLSPGAAVMETTSLRRIVSVELEVSKRRLVRRGDRVTITLPDGGTARGRVLSVGRVAKPQTGGGDSGGGGEEDGEAIVALRVSVRGGGRSARLDGAPVTVGIVNERERRALVVPVTALLARAGGGYAVEIVSGGRVRSVRVRTGLFADGYVAVTAKGLRPGAQVVVPG